MGLDTPGTIRPRSRRVGSRPWSVSKPPAGEAGRTFSDSAILSAGARARGQPVAVETKPAGLNQELRHRVDVRFRPAECPSEQSRSWWLAAPLPQLLHRGRCFRTYGVDRGAEAGHPDGLGRRGLGGLPGHPGHRPRGRGLTSGEEPPDGVLLGRASAETGDQGVKEQAAMRVRRGRKAAQQAGQDGQNLAAVDAGAELQVGLVEDDLSQELAGEDLVSRAQNPRPGHDPGHHARPGADGSTGATSRPSPPSILPPASTTSRKATLTPSVLYSSGSGSGGRNPPQVRTCWTQRARSGETIFNIAPRLRC
jgi:hypothetical protein